MAHARISNLYSGVIPIMLNKIDDCKPPTINGDGSQAYDFIYVDDVARSNVLAMESDATDEFYNIGTGTQTTIRELCDTILNIKQSPLKVAYKPYDADDARIQIKHILVAQSGPNSILAFNTILLFVRVCKN